MPSPHPSRYQTDPAEPTPATARPRRRGGMVARWIYRFIFLVIGGNVAVGAVQAFLANGTNSIPSARDVEKIYLVRLAMAHPYWFWPLFVVLLAAGVWGFFQDRLVERGRLSAEAERAVERRMDEFGRIAEEAARHKAEDIRAVLEAQARASTVEVPVDGPRVPQSVVRVFISSTSVDLVEHRRAVREALARMDLNVIAMEFFGARGTGDASTVSVQEVAECDIYVGIVAWRYGYVPTGQEYSVTHQEYLEALRLDKPCFIFLAEDATEEQRDAADLFPGGRRDPEHADALHAFRQRLKTDRVLDFFTTPDNLAAKVATAIHRWLVETGTVSQLSALTPTDFSGTTLGLPLPLAAARGGTGPGGEKGLIGRDAELTWLTDRILERKSAGIWAVSGMGGIGKTALAAVCVETLRDRLTGGVAVIRADSVAEPGEVLRRLVRKFIKEGDRLIARTRGNPDALSVALSGVLAQIQAQGRLALVVIDNVEPDLAHSAELKQVLDLLQTNGVSVVLTSREELPRFYVQESLPLETLDEAEAIRLFVKVCDRFRDREPTGAERRQIAEICQTFEGHALATVLAAANLHEHQSTTLAAYREQLAQPYAVLDLASPPGYRGVGQVLASSYEQLPREAQRLFAGLGVLGARGCTIAAATALGGGLGQSETQAQESLECLFRFNLVGVVRPGRERIEMHPLVQQFTRRLFASTLPAADVDGVRAAMARHFAEWMPGKVANDLRFDAPNFLESLRWARANTPASDAALAGLTYALRWYWHDRFELGTAFEWLPYGYAAMERIGHRNALARLRPGRGTGIDWHNRQSALALAIGVHYQLDGKIDEAESWFRKSFQVARASESIVSLAEAQSGLAAIAQQKGESEKARKLFEKSLQLFERLGDRYARANALYRLGFLALRVGDTDAATSYFEHSLRQLSDAPEDEEVRGVVYYSLGNVLHQTGDLDQARERYREGLATCERNNNLRGKGAILKALGDLAWQTSGPTEALEYLPMSLQLLRQIFDRQGEGVALYSYAFVLRQVGQVDDAMRYYRESLAIRTSVNDKRGEAFVLKAIGDVKRRTAGYAGEADIRSVGYPAVRTDMKYARKMITRGLELSREVKDRRNTAVALKALGDWEWQSGNVRRARGYYEESIPLRALVHDQHGSLLTRKALADVALTQGRTEGLAEELAACAAEFERMGDVRGRAAVAHSRAILAWQRGDTAAAGTLLGQSLDLFQQVSDQQSQAVLRYGLACLAQERGDLKEAFRLFREGLASAELSRAVLVGAFLEEGYGLALVEHGAAAEAGTGRTLLVHAAEIYRALGREEDAKRVDGRLDGKVPDRTVPDGTGADRLVDRAARVLVFDLDEGPNGQGFAIPNDRRRTIE